MRLDAAAEADSPPPASAATGRAVDLGRLAALLLLGSASCQKVGFVDLAAGFSLADAAWFAEEQTLFVFYEVRAEQGIGDESVVELRYETDDGVVDWTPLLDLPRVHTHLTVDCGPNALCGSRSIPVAREPRGVELRMRYHRDGRMALRSDTVFNVVGPGPPHANRSLVVYGVFEETNGRIQWRARHQLPTVRNERAEALGLRRQFWIRGQRFGEADLVTGDNPYGYGAVCPEGFTSAGLPEVETDERAVFDAGDLPPAASVAPVACAEATVEDALGTFTTGAVAQKNPEVRPAFPLLRSPVRDATPLRFFLAPCDRQISSVHEEMQRQRLLADGVPVTCTDDVGQPGFVDGLVVAFTDAVEAGRRAGRDLVLVVGVHRDQTQVASAVEEALAAIVPEERHRSSPRLAGAFVFDSDIRGLEGSDLASTTLWCPSEEDEPTASSRSCAVAPDQPDLELGPFSFNVLPILPSRDQYLDFIETYSVRQAGQVDALTFRVPEFAATSDHLDFGDFGVVTFLNDELISADDDDAFSYCIGEDPTLFVVRSPLMQGGELELEERDCVEAGIPTDICAAPDLGLLPLQHLPLWHELFSEHTYDLGVFWEFPFLLRMDYELVFAGAVTAFGLSVPFGVASTTEAYWGTEMWTTEELHLEERIAQCLRFCDHPTFDSAGVYHIRDGFRSTYANACYLPSYPAPGDSGFPRDP